VRYPDRVGQSQDSRIAPILANELASLRSNVSLLLLRQFGRYPLRD
jgi:tyrosinase